ncbi:MAG: hypothetical protein H0U74_19350 [Bradymonadaceae bacterium]|nr:hypothetical protein [Lujinxingiaceae bacterium]
MSVVRSFFALALVLFALGALGGNAFAAEPSERELKQAREHFDQGALFYTQGEYSKAIVEFLKGNELSPNAMFLYNISLCYEHIGNVRQALGAAERATRLPGMPAGVVVRNEARIRAFNINITGHELTESMANVAKVEVKPPVEEEPAGASLGTLGWTGVAVAGVGVALLAGGGYMNVAIQDDLEAYRQAAATGDGPTYYRLNKELKDSQSTGQILLVSGGILATAGVALLVYDLSTSDDRPKRSARLLTSPTKGGAVLGLKLDF